MTAAGGRRADLRRRHGLRAEQLAAEYLGSRGWRILGRRVRVGRDEVDIVAIDPAGPAIVVVEVRSRSTSRYGAAQESVDGRKVARLYRASAGLRAAGMLPGGPVLPAFAWRVDLIAIEDAPAIGDGAGGAVVHHLRALEPG